MRQNQRLLGDMMVESGLITAGELKSALAAQRESGALLGEILVSMGLFGEEALRWALARQLDVPLIHPDPKALDPAALELVSPEKCRRYGVLPITLLPLDDDPNPVLTIAAADPSDQAVIEDVRRGVPYKVHVVAALREEISKCLDKLYGPGPKSGKGSANPEADTRSDPTGIKLLARLADSVASSGAITLRIFGQNSQTFCRDGKGATLFSGNAEWLPILAERVRVLAGMKAEERRGRLHFTDGSGADVLLRVVFLATMEGEEIHLRVLTPENKDRTLGELGFTPAQISAVRAATGGPGLVLVAARGGGGLISTLYGLMRESGAEPGVAIEEEVVYRSAGTTQVESSSRAETTALLGDLKYMEFAKVLVGHADRELIPDLLTLARRGKLVLAGMEEADIGAVLAALTEAGKKTPLAGLCAVVYQTLTLTPGPEGRYDCSYRVLPVEGEAMDLLRRGETAGLAGKIL